MNHWPVCRRGFFLALLVLACLTLARSQSESSLVAGEWLTFSERTDYRETPRYNETIAFARKLDAASPLIRFTSFGKSGEGRELPLLIAAKGGTFTLSSARNAGKAIILVQACIHAGESDGKDAGLALFRDIGITKTREALLDHAVILFIPIYNTDGHERFGPYNRINQNGPREMGWRTTSTRLNLNRDYMKADAPETRSWLRLWNEWNPDLFVDCHVTDGADFRYNVTYQYEHHQGVPASILEWEREAIDRRAVASAEKEGNLLSLYLEFRDNRDLTRGVSDFSGTPRFSTAYAAIRNRPGLLIETHMLKDYRSRVRGTYDFLVGLLQEVNRDPGSLRDAARAADDQTIAEASISGSRPLYPLNFELTDQSRPYPLKGVKYTTEMSDVSGALRVIYGTEPVDITVPLYDQFRVTASVAPPLYYIVPVQWTPVVDVLKAHGLKLQLLARASTLEIETYRFSEVKFASASFEGRILASFKTEPVRERRTFPAGSIVVPMAQPAARVAVHLLEPGGPDSLVAWGFFNAIFEQKEFGESYVLEKIAREMMAKDPRLRKEFEQRLASDAKFAASPRQRLEFFYTRSPYRDSQLNLYPVGRLNTTPANLMQTLMQTEEPPRRKGR
ncbi:MAG: M14 family metallopeptidase [Pyrinomonadaceae bacterium]